MEPRRYTIEEIMAALAHVEPQPVPMYCCACLRCSYENPNVALGFYTPKGLAEHLEQVHGEVAR